MRVVVYAEGTGEAPAAPIAPGKRLPPDCIGAAHILIERCLTVVAPEEPIDFEAPLRVRARWPRGSDLMHRRTLRQLLTWPRRDRAPDLTVVLVDQDEDTQRCTRLAGFVADLPVAHVVGAAVREFEAWLLADTRAVTSVIGRESAEPPSVESLPPGEAKRMLADALATLPDARAARLEIACRCDLGRLDRLRAFELFRKDLVHEARRVLRDRSR